MFETPLESDIQGDTSGPFQRLLVMALQVRLFELEWVVEMNPMFVDPQGVRDNWAYDPAKAEEQAAILYNAGKPL